MFVILKSDYFQMRELLSSKYTNIMLITYKKKQNQIKKKTYIGRKIYFFAESPNPLGNIFFTTKSLNQAF